MLVLQTSQPRPLINLVLIIVLLSLVPGVPVLPKVDLSGERASFGQPHVDSPRVLQQPVTQTLKPLTARELVGPLLLLTVLAWLLRQRYMAQRALYAALTPAVSSPHLLYLTRKLQLEGG
jgi:hypothetical protein